MGAQRKPVRQKGEVVSAEHVKELLRKIGTTAAAKKLGVSTTTLHKARNSGLVSKVIEVAAKAELEQIATNGATITAASHVGQPASKSTDTCVVLLEIRPEQMPFVEKLAIALRANILKA